MEMKTFTIPFIGDELQLTQGYAGDAGFDLAYNGTTPFAILPQSTAKIPTGVRVAMPDGMYAIITGRSSTFAKRTLITPMSIIDSGFRGELFAMVYNYGHEQQTLQPGERIIQLLPMVNLAGMIRWQNVGELPTSERAEQGFGSSGR